MASNTARRIKDMPKIDRPRDKLSKKGAQSLSEFELLQVMIGSGGPNADVSELARAVQLLVEKGMDNLTYDKLIAIKGLSQAKASAILASLEITKRYVIESDEPLKTAADFAKVLADISHKKQEYLVAISLDGAQRIIAKRVITVGLLDSVQIHPREVFADAITDRAASVVVGHNHPSGEVKPSMFDIGLNQQLVAAARIIGIELKDHIIITKRGFLSFKEEGLI